MDGWTIATQDLEVFHEVPPPHDPATAALHYHEAVRTMSPTLGARALEETPIETWASATTNWFVTEHGLAQVNHAVLTS
jgi:hypothetical protein